MENVEKRILFLNIFKTVSGNRLGCLVIVQKSKNFQRKVSLFAN